MKTFFIAGLLFTVIASGCANNSELNKSRTNDALFKATLAKEMAARPKSFDFKLDGYFVKDGKEYLSVNVSRTNFNATIPVRVSNWDKLEGIKQTKGMGYRGAGLDGLKLALVNNNEFEYRGLDHIVD